MLCPYRASFVTQSFTQGVAIGLDMFKSFQDISRLPYMIVRKWHIGKVVFVLRGTLCHY